ncbi:MAG: branched-chain amino acid ABC transporter permease [Dehalococcoidia bacterium]
MIILLRRRSHRTVAVVTGILLVVALLALVSAQQFVNGFFTGAIYALFAVGYTLVFGVLDILNLAHQAVFMLGAVVSLALVRDLRTHGFRPPLAWIPGADSAATFMHEHQLEIWVALALTLVICGLAGILLDLVAFRPIRRRSDTQFSAMISSIALALIIEAVVLRQVGPNPSRFPFGSFPVRIFAVAGVTVTLRQLVIVAVALLFTVGLHMMLRRTRTGRAIRAVAENPRAARLLGVNVNGIITLSFFISSALGGVAGLLYGLEFAGIAPDMGRGIELKGLAVIILGGMGSIPGALIGGLLLGLTESYTVQVLGAKGSTLKDAAAFTVLFLILLVRPRGLLGRKAVREA